MDLIGVVHVGLGPIGRAVGKLVSHRADLETVAAIDVAPEFLGKSLSAIIGEPSVERIRVLPEMTSTSQLRKRNVAVLCTHSSLDLLEPQVMEWVAAGFNVVSTCEQLSYPWRRSGATALRIHRAAMEAGVSVLGTGVNPGFAMDYLPIVLAGTMAVVKSVDVHRVQDASTRRLQLQAKVGAGLSVEQFQREVAARTLGHVGLAESAHMIAAALGSRIGSLEESIEPVVADVTTSAAVGTIQPGRALGTRHAIDAMTHSGQVVRLLLEMAVGLPNPRDEVHLAGDPDRHFVVSGGLHGDETTVAVVANSIRTVAMAPPGLLATFQLPPSPPSQMSSQLPVAGRANLVADQALTRTDTETQ